MTRLKHLLFEISTLYYLFQLERVEYNERFKNNKKKNCNGFVVVARTFCYYENKLKIKYHFQWREHKMNLIWRGLAVFQRNPFETNTFSEKIKTQCGGYRSTNEHRQNLVFEWHWAMWQNEFCFSIRRKEAAKCTRQSHVSHLCQQHLCLSQLFMATKRIKRTDRINKVFSVL